MVHFFIPHKVSFVCVCVCVCGGGGGGGGPSGGYNLNAEQVLTFHPQTRQPRGTFRPLFLMT